MCECKSGSKQNLGSFVLAGDRHPKGSSGNTGYFNEGAGNTGKNNIGGGNTGHGNIGQGNTGTENIGAVSDPSRALELVCLHD